MPTKNIYISDEDVQHWDAVQALAKRQGRSMSKVISAALRNITRDMQQRETMGLPLGVPVPKSMKDPEVLRRERFADDLRARVLEWLEERES